MEINIAKVLDNSCSINLKRKHASSATYHARANCATPTQLFPSSSSENKHVKRRKLDGYKSQCLGSACHSAKSLIRYYSNFMKTGPPKRVMFYQGGEWIDYPQKTVVVVQKELQVKKAAFEIEVNGHRVMLDILHMIQLDLKSGSQKPIAWIDEAGSCFFPEILFDDEEENHLCQHECQFRQSSLVEESYGSCDVKLQLEIDISGVDYSKLKECSGESNTIVKQLDADKKGDDNLYGLDASHYSPRNNDTKIHDIYVETQEMEGNLISRVDSVHPKLDPESVRNMFTSGMSSFASFSILDIFHGSSSSLQARRELFEKQADITRKYRGEPNVQFAWLTSSKDAASSILKYGIGHCGTSIMKSNYGTGVHLSAGYHSSTSASFCDDDENGIRYMILCSVVVGNTEVVRPGSNQFHPSSEEFDTGVDNLENPRCYVVWNMNMTTHIYPEYVVRFTVSSNEVRVPTRSVTEEKNNDVSEVTSLGPQVQQPSDPSRVVLGSYYQQISHTEACHGKAATPSASTPRAPKSPWMPFPMLLEAIATKLVPEDMNLLNIQYELFKCKKISREDFIKKLRVLSGDTLLRSTITNLRKMPSLPARGPVVPKQVKFGNASGV